MDLSFDDAARLLDIVQREARRIGKPVTAAIVDPASFLIGLHRMTGARPMTTHIATAKASAAVVMRRSTRELQKLRDEKPSFFAQLSMMSQYPLVAEEGGAMISRGGILLGGIGISGASGEEDQEMCEIALRSQGYDLTMSDRTMSDRPMSDLSKSDPPKS
jgi:uncharacterized protein GlcG (DUF336 family)